MSSSSAPPAAVADDRRAAVGLALGVAVVLLLGLVDLTTGGRTFPLTAVLLGPLTAAALAPAAVVAAVGVLALLVAAGLAVDEALTGVEAWSRLLLVLAAGAASCAVAHVRTRHEQALARADRAAALATALQQGLLPRLRGTTALSVRAVYRPTQRDLVLGGDFMDAVPAPWASDGALAFCVGDVTGHDAAAASLGASLRAGWRALALTGETDPAAWLQAMADLVRHEAAGADLLATACVGLLEPARRRLVLASAGHQRPVLLTAGSATTLEVEAGPPLGLPHGLGEPWRSEAVGLETAFSLVVYTDGLVEGRRAPGSPSRYGEESLAAWLGAETRTGEIGDDALGRLLADVQAANGGPLQDDVALMVLSSTAAEETLAAQRLPVALLADPLVQRSP